MSFNMIREAQARRKLGEKFEHAKHVQELMGAASVFDVTKVMEEFDPAAFQISPTDYNDWMEMIQAEAQDRGVDISKKAEFMDFAHDMLDDDSKMEALGADIPMKEKIVGTLWKAAQASLAHNQVKQHVHQHIEKTREEEEAVDSLTVNGARERRAPGGSRMPLDTTKASTPSTQGQKFDHKHWSAMPMPRRPLASQENEESQFSAAMKDSMGIEDEALSHKSFEKEINKPARNNPYKPNTLRHALWADRHPGFEDEEDQEDVMDDTQDDQQPTSGAGEMSPDDIAMKITGMTGQPRAGEQGEDEDLEARVDNLEHRLDAIEGGDEEQQPEGEGEAMMARGEDVPKDDEDELPPEEGEDPMTDETRLPESEMHEEDEETQVKNFFHRAITAPKDMLQSAIKDVESEGASAWHKMQLPSNPHPRKSHAHIAWAKGMKNAAKEALGLNEKPTLANAAKKSAARRK